MKKEIERLTDEIRRLREDVRELRDAQAWPAVQYIPQPVYVPQPYYYPPTYPWWGTGTVIWGNHLPATWTITTTNAPIATNGTTYTYLSNGAQA